MDLPVLRVSDLACPACGHQLDAKRHKVLATATCPSCERKFTVPALFSNYQINGILGSGGSGVVLDGFDNTLQRRVAIKVLNAGGDADKIAMEATNEARALARLNHPHIVPIHSLGEHKGHKFIDMGLLSGGDARQYVGADKRLDTRAALDLAIDIADALRAAHRVKLVHMDVKPGNILFDDTGEPKLIDFGAAQHAKMRKSKGVVGTPYYIAPEVATGSMPNAQSDIYSLGATVFHLLTGQPPFDAKDARTVIAKRLKEPAPRVRDVRPDAHPAFADVIDRMLATKPADRPADYDTLLDELHHARQVLDDPMADVRTQVGAAAPVRQRKRKSGPAWAGPAVAVVGVVLIGVVLMFALDTGAPATTDPPPPDVPDTPDTPDPPDTPYTPPPDAGRIVREFWRNVPGDRIALATDKQLHKKPPTSVRYVQSLAHNVQRGDNYAERYRGFIIAPTTGEYRFLVSADDSAELRLSTDDSPRNLRKVLTLDKKLPASMFSEPSRAVNLVAGERYAFELYHKEAGELDHVVLGWQMPDGTRQLPIRKDYFAPPKLGLLTVERWKNIAANDAASAAKEVGGRTPDATALLTAPRDVGIADKTFSRAAALLRVPADGKYTIEVIANASARVLLSDTSSPDRAKQIVATTRAAGPNAPNDAARSEPIELAADTPYYLIVEHLAGGAKAHFAVGLVHPDGFSDQPIPGSMLEVVD